MSTDEGTAISAVLDGDTEAFQPLFDRHRELLFRVIVKLVPDVDQAEELTQEAFLRAFSQLHRFRDESRFSTWLVQIGIHLAHDANRHALRCGFHFPLDEQRLCAEVSGEPDHSDAGHDPEQKVLAQEARQIVLTAIGRLPDDYRNIIFWKYFRDWSFAEMSEVSGESVGTLKVRAHRARRMLRRELDLDLGPA